MTLLLSACGGPRAADAPGPESRSGAPAPPAPVAPAPKRAVAAPAPSAPTEAPTPFPARFQREREQPCAALALDQPPHIAALGPASVAVRDKSGWHDEALPKAVAAAPELRLQVFYGRDFRIRVVGTHAGTSGPRTVYLRAMPGGLKPAPYELGRLGNPSGGFVAVLGTADPEVVCRPGDVCLIKRLSGWTNLPAPADLTHAAIARGNGFVLAGRQIFRADREWVSSGPPGPWEKAGALFAVDERLFVLEPERALIHELANGAWTSVPSPVGAPTSLWGATATQLWLVGAAGLAHFDGKLWRPVPGAPPGLVSVLGRSADDVWFAGASGLYRLVLDKP